MAAINSRMSSYVAAALLAIITLGTFYSLRDYGPESAIQHFHSAAISGDLASLERFTAQSINDSKVQWLAERIRQIDAVGGHPQVVKMEPRGQQVLIWLAYVTPSGDQVDLIVWFLGKTRAFRWVVDADSTF